MEAKARILVNESVKDFKASLLRKLDRFGLQFRSVQVNVKFIGEKSTIPRKLWPKGQRMVPLSPQIPDALLNQALKIKLPQGGRKLIEGLRNCGNQPISGYGMRQAYDAWYNTIMTTNSALRKAGIPLQLFKVNGASSFPDREYRLFTVEPPTNFSKETLMGKKSKKPAKTQQRKSRKSQPRTTETRNLETELIREGSFGIESQKDHRLRMGF